MGMGMARKLHKALVNLPKNVPAIEKTEAAPPLLLAGRRKLQRHLRRKPNEAEPPTACSLCELWWKVGRGGETVVRLM
jgi:hypothetical protein